MMAILVLNICDLTFLLLAVRKRRDSRRASMNHREIFAICDVYSVVYALFRMAFVRLGI